MRAFEKVHQSRVLGRRVRILAQHIDPLVPQGSSVLDVGSGDGLLAQELLRRRSDVTIRGVDVLPRETCAISVTLYDGLSLPFPNDSFGTVTLVDVLHHAEDPVRLLREAARVTASLVIKDHTSDRPLAATTLRIMDRIGNARHGVALPYCYWRRRTWLEHFGELGLEAASWESGLGLYPAPLSWVFGGSLQFLARVVRK